MNLLKNVTDVVKKWKRIYLNVQNVKVKNLFKMQIFRRLTHGKSTPPLRAARLLPIALDEIPPEVIFKMNKKY